MTREEAVSKAINIVRYFEAHFAKSKEAREDAANIIEALEQEPCGDAISRQDLREPRFIIAENDYQKGWNDALESVYENAPSIQPQPKMGRWIYKKEEDSYRCSLCGFPCHKDNLGAIPTKYCAGCGAKMSEIPTGAEGSDKE